MAFERLNYLVTLDPTGATSGLSKIASVAKAKVGEADKEVQKLQDRIDKLNAKSVKLGRKGDVLGADVATLQAKNLQGELSALTAPAGAVGGLLARVGLGGKTAGAGLSSTAVNAAAAGGALLGVSAAVGFVKSSVGTFQELTSEVRAFQRVTGASAEEASGLTFAMKRLGIDSEAGAKALFLLGKNVEGSQDKLADLGVTVDRDSKGNVNLTETLKNVADAYKGTDDQARKNALAAAAFGRGGAALIPLLGKTREELDALQQLAADQGLIFDKDQLAQGRDLSLATKDIGTALQGIKVDTATAFVPLILQLREATAAVAPVVHQLGLVKKVITGSIAATPILGQLFAYRQATKDSSDATKVDTKEKEENTAAFEAQAEAADAAAKKISDANRARLSAAEALLSADDRLTAAKKAVAEASDDEAEKAEKVADARRGEEDAADRVAEAEDRLAKARRDAPRDIALAGIAARDAARTEAEAIKDRDKALRRRGPNDPKTLEAQDRLAAATIGVAKAQDELNELQGKGGVPSAVADAIEARDGALRTRNDAEKRTAEIMAFNPYEAQERAAGELRKAEQDRLLAVSTLQKILPGVTGEMLKGLNVATATRAQLEAAAAALAKIVSDQAALAAAEATRPKPAPGAVTVRTPGLIPQQAGIVGGGIGSARSIINGQFNGPITVQANDPGAMQRALEAEARRRRLNP